MGCARSAGPRTVANPTNSSIPFRQTSASSNADTSPRSGNSSPISPRSEPEAQQASPRSDLSLHSSETRFAWLRKWTSWSWSARVPFPRAEPLICYVHFFDVKIAERYVRSIPGYFTHGVGMIMARPGLEACAGYFRCTRPDYEWDEAHKDMSVIKFGAFTVQTVFNPLLQTVLVGFYFEPVMWVLSTLMVVIQVMGFSHMGWYCVTQEHGCAWCPPCNCCCFKSQLFLLLWIIFLIVRAVCNIYSGFNMYVPMCPLCFLLLPAILFFNCTDLYLGLCTFKIWQSLNYPMCDSKVRIVSPRGMTMREYGLHPPPEWTGGGMRTGNDDERNSP